MNTVTVEIVITPTLETTARKKRNCEIVTYARVLHVQPQCHIIIIIHYRHNKHLTC